MNHEEHEGHQGKEKRFFVLFVFFVVPFFSETFATPSFEGVAKSLKALNHEEHEGHKGTEKRFFVLFVVQGFSAVCNRFLRGQGFGLNQENLSIFLNQINCCWSNAELTN